MKNRTCQIKARKILGDYWVVPKDWNNKYLKNWFRKNEDIELQDGDIEVVSLLTVPRGSHLTIAQSVERGEFGLNKPRII